MADQIINPFDSLYKSMTNKSTKWQHDNPSEFPAELHVELTNRCNLKCDFCPIGCREIKRPTGNMREDLFWAICTEAYEYDAALRLIRWGEPTLHVRCYDYIRMAKSINLLVHMNTNGVNLDVKEVIDSGLDSIKISLHTKEAFKSVVKLLRERGDRIKPFITVGTLIGEEIQVNRMKDVDAINKGTIKNLKKGGRAPKTCWELYNRLSIDWDGTVVACCGAYDRQMQLGSIYDDSTLKEIWDGDKLKFYRELEQKHRLDLCPLCNHCAR